MISFSDSMQFVRDIEFNAPAELALWDLWKAGIGGRRHTLVNENAEQEEL